MKNFDYTFILLLFSHLQNNMKNASKLLTPMFKIFIITYFATIKNEGRKLTNRIIHHFVDSNKMVNRDNL